MNRFEFARPTSVADAVALLSDKHDESALLAGGTDLLSLMKDFVVEPKRLVSLMAIGELSEIAANGAGISIGATTTLEGLLAAGNVNGWAAKWPLVWQAAAGVKSPQLRTMGTVGGELLQRPRCWYFRHGKGLCAEWNGESLPAKGDNRYHAVFGNSGPAKFVNASSLAPALMACGATVDLVGPKGKRTLLLKDLYATPKTAAERELALAANEVVTAIHLEAPAPKSATYEVRPRQGLDWPLATASVVVKLDGAKVTGAKIVLGHVAPTPWIADDAAKTLIGQPLNDKTIAAAASAAVAGATPLSKNAYKVDLAKVAVRRALTAAAGAA
jgi:xanthine dehydrogenase YagS FAD-binding subunit